MKPEELLKIYDQEQRIGFEMPGVLREHTGRVIRHTIWAEKEGFISYSALDEASADAEIASQVDYFRSLGYSFEWKLYDHDRPADLKERLLAHGFAAGEPEALVVLDLEEAPRVLHLGDTSRVERVTTWEGIQAIMAMEETVWQEDKTGLGKYLYDELAAYPDRLSVFAIWESGQVASAAWVRYHPGTRFASLWGGSTLPGARGRGYYTALLAARAREAFERGYRCLTVDASPMSRPILERHGFQFLGFTTPCVWQPAGDAADSA